MKLTEKISDYIESRQDYLVDATKFLRVPSPSRSEGAVARLLLEELEGAGFKSWIDAAGNVLGLLKGDSGGGGPRLVFNVHLDHVPPGNPSSWRHGPFGGAVENGRVYGRGASDTKGAWAPMILAMEAVNERARIIGDVLFTGVVMEELTYCFGMRHLLECTLNEMRPDYMVLGEATGLNVAVGHRGRTELEVTTRGRACHASAPWRGENALYKAAHVIISMEELSRELMSGEEHPLLGRSTLAVTDIRCSPGAHNVVPEECRFYMDYRFLPEENLETVLRKVSGRVKLEGVHIGPCEREEETYTGLRFTGIKYMPGFVIPSEHHLVREVASAAESVLKTQPKIQRWDFD